MDKRQFQEAFDLFIANNEFDNVQAGMIMAELEPFLDDIRDLTHLQFVLQGIVSSHYEELDGEEDEISFSTGIGESHDSIIVVISLIGLHLDTDDLSGNLCDELQALAEAHLLRVAGVLRQYDMLPEIESEDDEAILKRLFSGIDNSDEASEE